MGFLGQGDYGRGLQTGWDSGLGQKLVENLDEDYSQLIRTVLQHTSRDAIGSSSLPWVEGLEHSPDLTLLYCEGEAGVDCGV